MLFNSISFLVFFAVVLGLYFMPWQRCVGSRSLRARQILLLIASYFFYMCWRAEYAVLIMLSTGIDYYAGLRMGSCTTKEERRPYLFLSLLVNLGLLFSFKYLDFFNGSMTALFGQFGLDYPIPAFNILLPVGISFYTFQTLGYSIDVYRGDKKPERDLVVFALYVSFFPQLVAGPIERSRRLIPQFHSERTVTWQGFVNGFAMILWGFFMKVVIADNIAPYVVRVFAQPEAYTGGHYIVASGLFAYQVFCDFAGYSAIAIGTAAMMGYRMMQNFRRPFFARSMTEFWGRWHVSLMTWFRDYVYKGLRVKEAAGWRIYLNLFIVYMLSGIWHGANWTFVAWGLVNWVILALERLVSQWEWAGKHKRPRWLELFGVTRVLECVCVFSMFALPAIFFRSPNISQALSMYRGVVNIPPITTDYVASLILPFTSDYSALAMCLFVIASLSLLELVHVIQETGFKPVMALWQKSALFKGACLTGLALIILLFGNFDSQAFIYFQF